MRPCNILQPDSSSYRSSAQSGVLRRTPEELYLLRRGDRYSQLIAAHKPDPDRLAKHCGLQESNLSSLQEAWRISGLVSLGLRA